MDTLAEVLSWVVIIIAPVVMSSAFWLLHIIPEKVAEERQHPQLDAIKMLCLLSLFFGGLLLDVAVRQFFAGASTPVCASES